MRKNKCLQALIALFLFSILIFGSSKSTSAATNLRRPISPEQPMWLIHIDTWNYADPQKIINLVPEDIRPFVVMNISLSISHNEATSQFQVAEYGYEIAKSWIRVCAENQMWCMVQPSSGGFSQFSDFDLSVYEEFYRDYPNFIGFNYAEQFWGYDSPTDPLSAKWSDRYSHFANLLELSYHYGGYLVVSWCGNQWSPTINPIAMVKRNPDFAEACRNYTENYILCEKYTQQSYQSDMESICLGSYLSGYSGQYGIRYDDTGWTDTNGNHENFSMATAGAVHLEHIMLTGETVIDGPELIWTQCFRESNRISTTDGYSARNWETFPQFVNVNIDLFRKILDGTVRIPSRKEVIERTKYVVVNDVNTGNSNDIYSSPSTLFQGLYRMDGDGNYENNKTFFKKTGRYPTIPTVFELDDSLANTFEFQINRSEYSSRWPNINSKTTELDTIFPSEYSGDLFAGRHENGWVTYNPYKTGQTASASIPFKYNTCDHIDLSYSQYTAGVIKEFGDSLKIYLSNYDNVINTGLKTDEIKIYGSKTEPTYNFRERGNHQASEVSSSWTNGVFTLTIKHNGAVDITVECSGDATDRLIAFTESVITEPAKPAIYTGPRQYEAECFDYKNISNIVTGGQNAGVRYYTGQGYLYFGTNPNASVRKTVNVIESGFYQLDFKYSALNADMTSVDLIINGTKVSSPVFTKTVSASEWSVCSQKVELNAGENIIELTANAATESNLILDNIVIGPETYYDFESDVATTNASDPAAKFIKVKSGSAGVVNYINENGLSGNGLKAYSNGNLNETGVADLERIPLVSNYSITWKEYLATTGTVNGILLRANEQSCSYAEGMQQGYLFTITSNDDRSVSLQSYIADSADILLQTTFTSTFSLEESNPLWFRATATNNELLFECSADSINWEGASEMAFYNDAYTTGATQLLWGFGSNNFDWIIDDITYLTSEISVSNASVTGMAYLQNMGPSTCKAVAISGKSLTGAVDITVTDNYEISFSKDTDFTSSLNINYTGSSLDTVIYVRLKADFDTGAYSGEITVNTKGAAAQIVALNGSVITKWIYNFSDDVASTSAGTPPAINISSGNGNGATAGVVSYRYTGGGYTNCLRAYSGGERNSTGVLDLDLFPADSANYSITWKQAIGSNNNDYKVGVILRASDLLEGSMGYVAGIKQGYVFIVYNASGANPHSEFRIYKSTGETSLNMLVNIGINSLIPDAGKAMWYRASANGTESTLLKLEYSTDNENWFTAASYTDATTTFDKGSSQIIWGLAAANWDFYLDNITYDYYMAEPSIAVSEVRLTNFTYEEGKGPSEGQSFDVFGNNLPNSIEITAPEHFEVSLDNEGGYSDFIEISDEKQHKVFVRLIEGLSEAKYKETLSLTSIDATSKEVSLNGTVTLKTRIDQVTGTNATVISKEYYTVTGQKVGAIENLRGLYIEKTLMSDGSIKTTKVMK